MLYDLGEMNVIGRVKSWIAVVFCLASALVMVCVMLAGLVRLGNAIVGF